MELAPVPRRRPWSARVWASVAFIVLAPVMLLALLPTAFGLERYVLSGSEMSGTLGRGAVVFERSVPIGDVRVGDVLTYRADAALSGAAVGTSSGEELVTRRVHRIDRGGALVLRADHHPGRVGDLLATADNPTVSRVVLGVPYVGYPFLGALAQPGWAVLVLVLGSGLGLASVPVAVRRPHRVATGPAH